MGTSLYELVHLCGSMCVVCVKVSVCASAMCVRKCVCISNPVHVYVSYVLVYMYVCIYVTYLGLKLYVCIYICI